MIPGCRSCTRKHLAGAEVYMAEAELGYPDHAWLAVGELYMAEKEILAQSKDLAEVIRDERLKYIRSIEEGDERPYHIDILDLIQAVGDLRTDEPQQPEDYVV